MDNNMKCVEDLGHEDMARLIMDMFHRTMVHHTLWFREVEHQMGLKRRWT